MVSFVKKLTITFLYIRYRISYILDCGSQTAFAEEVTAGLTGLKIYLQPMSWILNAIHDIEELQNGKTTFSDTSHGKTSFTVTMYGMKVEYRFTVTDTGKNRCRVQIEAEGDTNNKKRHIVREFALLDSMLINDTEIEIDD